MAGTSTETAIRALGSLKKMGIIASGRGQIRILDRAKLGSLSRRSYLIRQQGGDREGIVHAPSSPP